MRTRIRRLLIRLHVETNTRTSGLRFLALALWVCVAGALWLEPGAVDRRFLEERHARLDADVAGEQTLNAVRERMATGLQEDPSVIESEARRIGFARQGEAVYPLTAADLAAARMVLETHSGRPWLAWMRGLGRAAAPALMLLIGAVIAVLFFTNLRVDDPVGSTAPPIEKREAL